MHNLELRSHEPPTDPVLSETNLVRVPVIYVRLVLLSPHDSDKKRIFLHGAYVKKILCMKTNCRKGRRIQHDWFVCFVKMWTYRKHIFLLD
jgi:hypothetical protein